LDQFDYVIAMDRENVRNLERMAESSGTDVEIHLLREFDPERHGDEVPDPYYGGTSGFEEVFQIVSRSCQALLAGLVG
jgi:protein-tyrosine phosphatase